MQKTTKLSFAGRTSAYAEGDAFAVPLPSGGFAVAVVARVAPAARVSLGYFFGPKRSAPAPASILEGLRPADAVLVARFGDLGIIDGSWKRIGRLHSYQPAEWPMPDFQRKTPFDGRHLKVHYRDENPNSRPLETAITEREAATLPRDALLGSVAVGRVLESLLQPRASRDA